MRQWGVNNLLKVVAQQRHGRGSNPRPRPLDRKSDALPLSHRATPGKLFEIKFRVLSTPLQDINGPPS